MYTLMSGQELADGKYRVEGHIGRGATADVYLVRHLWLDRRYALKIPRADRRIDMARFQKEAQLQATLDHPNLVRVHDLTVISGRTGMVMEYVEGGALVAAGPLEPAEVDELVQGVLEGAAQAHGKGFVHRDLKPANVLISRSESSFVPKIADFGIAKVLSATRITRTGSTLGTLRYMAPEQLTDASRVDARADVFSLGILFYEIVCGAHPFLAGANYSPAHVGVEDVDCVPPAVWRSDLDPGLQAALIGALAPDPALRWSDARVMLDALEGETAWGSSAQSRRIETLLSGRATRAALSGPRVQQYRTQSPATTWDVGTVYPTDSR